MPAEPIITRGSKVPFNYDDYDDDISKLPRMICYPQKMYEEAVSLFQVRFKMHRTVSTQNSKTNRIYDYRCTYIG